MIVINKDKLDEFRGMILSIMSHYHIGQDHPHFDDVYACGVMGLQEAANRFDDTKKTQFSSYAWFWIRKRVREYCIGSSSVKNSRGMYHFTEMEGYNLDDMEPDVLEPYYEPVDQLVESLGGVLCDSEIAVLKAYMQGFSIREIAKLAEMSYKCAYSYFRGIEKKINAVAIAPIKLSVLAKPKLSRAGQLAAKKRK